MKYKRQAKILELIGKYDIETQDDLAERLAESGFETTQATISRDIKQLKIFKSLTTDNKYKYTARGAFESDSKEHKTDAKFYNILQETITKIDTAKNLIVVKTYSGMAQAAAAAIDAIDYPEIVGTIAGDDTILLVFSTDENANFSAEKLHKIVKPS